VKLYRFLVRRTGSPFNKRVLSRLYMSRMNAPQVSISKIHHNLKKHGAEHIAVVVGKVTNDERFHQIPKMTICALRFSETARARVTKAGGECLTFDQLALKRPTGRMTVLLRGARTAREANKHFGPPPGSKHSHTKAHVRSKGRHFERARGRRPSRGFKV